jgi:signal transduction histidine kinase
LVVTADDQVLLDTEGTYPRRFGAITEREAFLDQSRFPRVNNVLYKGMFVDDDGSEWLYVEQPLAFTIISLSIQPLDDSPLIQPGRLLVAESMPHQTIESALRDFWGSGFFLAFIQAGLIGMAFAFILSFLIVRWVSRPLLDVAHAASKVAEGDYAARVPVHGPDEVREVATGFNEMAARVELSQQAQRDFLANVSHDLRTPLTSIQGFAQAIAEGVASDAPSAQRAANIIHDEAGRLNRMVNELLDLARIQTGRMDMMRRAVELDTLLKTVGESMTIKAHEKEVRLEVQVPPLPRIAGDGDRLAQAFTNLVDNAIKHTASGGLVWLVAGLDGKHGLVVQVQDTGEGIPQEDLPRIFERFYQVDKSRANNSGTGLGLAITREIVQAHAGRIWVESQLGQGTRFSVWLPQPIGDKGQTVAQRRSSSS